METSDLRRHGRIDPEGAQWWTYVRRPDCFTAFRASPPRMTEQGEGAQVVRFALSGKALPMAFDTLRWGELARQCAMSQYGRSNRGAASQALSGKDASGKPLTGHGHVFYLPTDEDGDGRLDHLTVWAPGGLTAGDFQAVASVNTLNPGGQRDPVQLAYLAHGADSDFNGVSSLFSVSKSWRSLTPYVLPLDFTHFKRHKRGNLQYDGTEWRGVSVHRSWRSMVKNPPTPTTSGYAQR